MENTLLNKAKFFAQYFGQEVRIWKELPDNKCNVGYASLSEDAVKYSHLELTPLHLISDEDAIEVSKIYFDTFNFQKEQDIKLGIKFIEDFINNDFELGISFNVIRAVDFLRSKGYALPYNGLSVEEQVSRGWVQLRTEI